MKQTANIIKILAYILLLATISWSLSACVFDSTIFMDDNKRYEFLESESQKRIDPDKTHFSIDVTVDVLDNGEKYSYSLKYDEYYDATDAENVKFARHESVNDFTGITDSYTYADGIMYLSSENRSLKSPVGKVDEVFLYIPFYGIFDSTSVDMLIDCPRRSGGKYVCHRLVVESEKLKEMYYNLFWAIPSHLYDNMKVASYEDTITFDKDFRKNDTDTHIILLDKDQKYTSAISIYYKETVHYDDFEISAPEGGEDYHLLNNYSAAADAMMAVNNLLSQTSGQFSCSFRSDFSGAVQSIFIEKYRMAYSTSQSGILTYDLESKYSEKDGFGDSSTTSYDGTVEITRSTGKTIEKPLTQDEAWMTIYSYQNFLQLYDGAFDSITNISTDLLNRRCITFTLTQEHLSKLLEQEIIFIGVDVDKESVIATGECRVVISADDGYTIACEISLDSHAYFEVDGNPAELDYTYNFTIN